MGAECELVAGCRAGVFIPGLQDPQSCSNTPDSNERGCDNHSLGSGMLEQVNI